MVTRSLIATAALVAATRNPAEFLNQRTEWGTIEPGKRADLVLLSANPLADIRNTMAIESVIVGGRVLEKPELAAMIRRGTAAIDGKGEHVGR